MSSSRGMQNNQGSVFDRLFRTETASSAQKRSTARHSYHSPIQNVTHSRASRASRLNKETVPFSLVDRNKQHSGRKKDNQRKKAVEKPPEFNPPPPSPAAANVANSSSPDLPRLRLSSKFHPENGFSDLSPTSFDLTGSLSQYEKGEATPQDVAKSIISALFNRDFEDCKRSWDIAAATAEPVDGDNVFAVQKQATMELADVHSVATATGTIRFLADKREIHVENYCYNVEG